MKNTPSWSSAAPCLLSLAAALSAGILLLTAAGCTIGQLVGGMAASAQRTATHRVPAKYTDLDGKTFAVVVYADRIIQADFPEVVADLTVTISGRLADEKHNVGATGYVPGERVLQYQYSKPRWVVMNWRDLADEFGVQRLVVVEIGEFRLHDPGNRYTWSGAASATVRVIEADGPAADSPAFTEALAVRFPDKDGFGPMDMPASTVRLALSKRLADRISWLFYEHEELVHPEY